MTKKHFRLKLIVDNDGGKEDEHILGEFDDKTPSSIMDFGLSLEDQLGIMDKLSKFQTKTQIKSNTERVKKVKKKMKPETSPQLKVVETVSVEKINIRNETDLERHNLIILDNFENYLIKNGLSKKTIRNHVNNIAFFTNYLNNYVTDADDYRTLIEMDDGDIDSFLSDWFQRKAMWASVGAVKSNITSFKKFYQWMLSENLTTESKFKNLKETVSENKDDWFATCGIHDTSEW